MGAVKRVYQVDGRPFYPLGGQAMNQAGTSASEAEPAFRAVKAMHGNTLLIPVYWESVEPEENHFDFRSVDALLGSARHHGVRLLLLWFATWKNGNMDYAPAWVKAQPERFLRVIDAAGRPMWVLSSHCAATRQADTKALSPAVRAPARRRHSRAHGHRGCRSRTSRASWAATATMAPRRRPISRRPCPLSCWRSQEGRRQAASTTSGSRRAAVRAPPGRPDLRRAAGELIHRLEHRRLHRRHRRRRQSRL